MSNLVFEKLSQALAAGESWRLNIAGDFFRLSEAAYPVSVSLLKGQRIVGTMRNMLAGDYVRDIAFDGVIIDNGALAQSVSAQIAGGGAGSDRVLGEVSVVSGERFRTMAGASFWQSKSLTAAAGNLPHIQLWNPAGSGKRVVIEDIGGSVSASLMKIALGSVPLTTLVGNAQNKRLGGGLSAAELRTQESVSSIGNDFASFAFEPNIFSVLKLTSPIILDEGVGLNVKCGATGSTLQANVQFYEESI